MAFYLLNGDMGIIGKCCPRPAKRMKCEEVRVQTHGHIDGFQSLSDSRIRERLPTTRCVDLESRIQGSHWIQFFESLKPGLKL